MLLEWAVFTLIERRLKINQEYKMTMNNDVNKLLQLVPRLQQAGDFKRLIPALDLLLAKDPLNADYLLWKMKALTSLGQINKNLPLIQKYVNLRSTDTAGFVYLYEYFMETKKLNEAAIALTYALSINSTDERILELLTRLLAEISPNLKKVAINIMTTTRIGHLSCEIEPLLRLLTENKADDCLYIFIANGEPTANAALYSLLKRYANVVESSFWFNFYASRPMLLANDLYAEYPYDLNGSLRGIADEDISGNGFRNLIDIYHNSSAFMKIPEEDLAFAWRWLADRNINREDKIVCLHLRDAQYLNQIGSGHDWSYHDYRDASIENYEIAVTWLIERGYKVIRIGSFSNQKLPISSESYIDICVQRDPRYGDIIELMLIANCDFFLGTTSGPLGLAAIFDTPTLVLNATPFEPPYFPNSRFIPKRLVKEGKNISYLDVSAGKTLSCDNPQKILYCLDNRELEKYNYKYIENSPEDILAAVKEFSVLVENRVLKNTPTSAQLAYQQKLPPSFPGKRSLSMVCDSYLSTYPELFEYQDMPDEMCNNSISKNADLWSASNSSP